MRRRQWYFIALFCTTLHAAEPIIFWHSMAGELGQQLKYMVDQYNQSQQTYKILPVYKGTYTECLTSLAASYRANKKPDIVQILDIGTATMLHPKGIIKPLHEILHHRENRDMKERLLGTVHDYYADDKGRLLALPFNISIPVIFYNKQILQDDVAAIKTWEVLSERLQTVMDENNLSCGFTTTWPSWVHIEAFTVKHQVPFAFKKNGFDSINTQIAFDNPSMSFHLEHLKAWQKKRLFVYGGRTDDAQSLFTSQTCPMLFQSSGAYADLQKSVEFELGMMRMPYWSSLCQEPGPELIGGAALWVMNTTDQHKLEGIKGFFHYLLRADMQSYWQCHSGYISPLKHDDQLDLSQCHPLIAKSSRTLRDYIRHHGASTMVKGIRLGNHIQIRIMNDKMLESIWLGIKNPKEALSDTVKDNNIILNRFYRSVS